MGKRDGLVCRKPLNHKWLCLNIHVYTCIKFYNEFNFFSVADCFCQFKFYSAY